jgi:hypothetical protein
VKEQLRGEVEDQIPSRIFLFCLFLSFFLESEIVVVEFQQKGVLPQKHGNNKIRDLNTKI